MKSGKGVIGESGGGKSLTIDGDFCVGCGPESATDHKEGTTHSDWLVSLEVIGNSKKGQTTPSARKYTIREDLLRTGAACPERIRRPSLSCVPPPVAFCARDATGSVPVKAPTVPTTKPMLSFHSEREQHIAWCAA